MRAAAFTKRGAVALGPGVAGVILCTLVFPVGAHAAGVLKVGTSGPRVAAVHKAFGMSPGRTYSSATQGAVERFQRRHDLTADGVVGAQTWKLIKGIRERQKRRSGRKGGVLKFGARGPRVAAVHKAFRMGDRRVFSSATQAAVERFQRRHDLTADGVVGAQTWKLIKAIRERQKRQSDRRGDAAKRPASRRPAGGARKAKRGVLKLGVRGPRVAALHKAFRMRAGRVFSAATRAAVKRFQRRHGMTADGIVGAETWKLVKGIRERQKRGADRKVGGWAQRVRGPLRKRTTRREPRVVSRGSRVKLVQKALKLTADGIFGPATADAVRRLQRRHELRATGVVGPAVWTRLGYPNIRTVVRAPKLAVARLVLAGLTVARLPERVRNVVVAANQIARAPYRYGGGHGSGFDSGYDCSGSVSYALRGGGLLSTSLDSSGFMGWGEPGPGRWITVYAKPSHAFMTIGGVRFDTSGRDQTGSRWQPSMVSTAGYVSRHPSGL